MAGLEDVLVQWAPTVAPLADVASEDLVTLVDWQTIKTSGGETINDVTQQFTVSTAKIRLRNGHPGSAPLFVPETSYKGRNIRVSHPDVGGLFWGRIDRVEFHYDNTPWAAFVTLHCVDTLGNVSDAAVPDDIFLDTVDYFVGVLPAAAAVTRVLLEVLGAATVVPFGEFSHQLVKAPDKFDTRQGLLEFLNQVLLTEGAALYATPEGDLRMRGRWSLLRLLSAGLDAPIVFTDTPPPYGDLEFGYRRDDLEWSDADEGYVNSVQTRSKYIDQTVVEESIATDYPKVQLSRTELVTIRKGWVEADARMWHALYRQQYAYPKKVKFMVASRGGFQRSVFNLLGPSLIADRAFQVLHTPPGSTQRTYRVVPNRLEHDIDKQRWLCTLGFTSLDRWWNAYGNGVDPIELIEIDGDSDHGIDSLAIIAP